jgi:polysaccharide export outer membrane protein
MASRALLTIRLTVLLTAGFTAVALAQQPSAPGGAEGASAARREPGNGPTPLVTPDIPATGPREAAIMPRDTLTIQTLDQPGFSGKFIVDLDGTFEFPYIGRVKAAGLTVREVIIALKQRLVPNYLVNPQIAIELEQVANKKITVTGEVRAPAVYPFAGDLTVLTALTKAGSVTDGAAEEALVFRAGTDAGIPVNLHDLLSGTLTNNMLLQDGDTVLVPKAQPAYVSGEVRSPGAYAVRHGMTVQQVIALAGGVTEKGKTDGIKIQRMGADGKKLPDIKVKDYKTEIARPGDTIVVSRRMM